MMVVLSIIFILFACTAAKPRLGFDRILVSWRDLYQYTLGEKYFLAVNTEYNVAPISMEKGTDEYIYGVNSTGNTYLWEDGRKQYEINVPYATAVIGDLNDISSKAVFSATARKAMTNFDVRYVAVFKDRDGRIIEKVPQAQSEYRLWLDFVPPKPLLGVYGIDFELQDGRKAYIQNGLQIGYIK